MSLIVAIEPDRRQASRLARVSLDAELIVADSTGQAFATLGGRVPDLILTSLLLSPNDETALADRLRELDASGARIQTLVIPVLAATNRRAAGKPGLLKKLRRSASNSAPDGCDPLVFAAQIAEYLERAAAERARLAESLDDAALNDAARADLALESATSSFPAAEPMEPVFSSEAIEPFLSSAEELDPAFRAIETIGSAPWRPEVEAVQPALLSSATTTIETPAPVAVERPTEETPVIESSIPADEPVEPAVSLSQTETFEPMPPFLAVEDVDVPMPITSGPDIQVQETPAATELSSPDDLDEEHQLAAAEDGVAQRDQALPLELSSPAQWPTLEGMPPNNGAQSRVEIDAGDEVAAFLAGLPNLSLAADGAPMSLEIVSELPEDTQIRPAAKRRPTREVRRPTKAKKRKSHPPVQDEWGIFDPQQCGFAALLTKLDELAENEEAPADDELAPR